MRQARDGNPTFLGRVNAWWAAKCYQSQPLALTLLLCRCLQCLQTQTAFPPLPASHTPFPLLHLFIFIFLLLLQRCMHVSNFCAWGRFCMGKVKHGSSSWHKGFSDSRYNLLLNYALCGNHYEVRLLLVSLTPTVTPHRHTRK